MPLWVAEGTANTLAFLFEKADHPFLTTEADVWLRRPDCALWYQGFNCERCYGGVWWWANQRNVLRLYFEYLAAHSRDPFGIGNGVGALEAAFQGITPETAEGGTMVTPYLYVNFAFNFAPPDCRSRIRTVERTSARDDVDPGTANAKSEAAYA